MFNSVLQLSTTTMDKQVAFGAFLAEHGRSYASVDESGHRFEVFSAKYDEVMRHNAEVDERGYGFYKEINKFADLTEAEFTDRYLSTSLFTPDITDRI